MKKLHFLPVLLALMLCLCSIALADNSVYSLGNKMDDFTVTTYDGQTVTLSEVLKEKEAVLINIWATWCGPCRNEFPFMEEAYKQYSDKVEVIALSCEITDTNDVLSAFAKEMGLTFKVAQDTANLATRFAASAIPTSVMVDRFGTICFMEAGSLPDASSFIRLFDAFLGESYTESKVLYGIPRMKPNVAPSAQEELNAALNIEGGTLVFNNSSALYDWPMVAGEKDGRSVVTSSNTGVGDSLAWVGTSINAKAGDAVAVTFKVSSMAGLDVMQLYVGSELVKSFGGEDGWMTYAHPIESDGWYSVAVGYQNDTRASAGEDTLWVDSIAHLTGDAAAAALAANPAAPVADEMYIRALNESARKIVFTDPTGMISMYYGGEFYLIPDETAVFELGLTAEYDPELALVSFNYDNSLLSLADCLVDGKYVASCGGDSIETTGYCDSTVYLYPSLEDQDLVKTATYFRDEDNVNQFVALMTGDANGNVLGSWAYADAPAAALRETPAEAAAEANYVVKYVDQDGNPVPGVMCQVCDASTCQVFVADANGVCEFTLAPYTWEIHTLMIPEGYEGDTETVTIAPEEGGDMVFTLTRK
ncbi:MAG: TlpA family protein disulfide reductase [Clostridia bacterium]|nr:TlpA family protein disulfide reductase [Clostridia bacterium]